MQAMRDSDGGAAETDKASTSTKVDATLYRSIVGGLRYLVHTRPDIAFVVGYVSRFIEIFQPEDIFPPK